MLHLKWHGWLVLQQVDFSNHPHKISASVIIYFLLIAKVDQQG